MKESYKILSTNMNHGIQQLSKNKLDYDRFDRCGIGIPYIFRIKFTNSNINTLKSFLVKTDKEHAKN